MPFKIYTKMTRFSVVRDEGGNSELVSRGRFTFAARAGGECSITTRPRLKLLPYRTNHARTVFLSRSISFWAQFLRTPSGPK